MPAEAAHVPVMAERVAQLLAPALAPEGSVFVDATVGLGGHTREILGRFATARVVGIDRDAQALEHSRKRLAGYADRFTGVQAVYDQVDDVLSQLSITRVQGVLFDLGVSSLQLDAADRGFAYSVDAPLDMRMDQSRGVTAAQVLNTYSADELKRVFRRYGEERYAARIAAVIVSEREKEPFTTSARLVELIRKAIPAAAQRTGGNPAKRTFQALRIEVNGELAALERALPAAIDALAVGGRIVVLSYHSLEDRFVKRTLSAAAVNTTPEQLPVELPGHQPRLKLLTRAEKASEEERTTNPRAASVRLRAAECLREAA